jgi:hypothetical protein
MATEAQIEANRANAQKSTGPRTPEGKEKAAQNALRHGLFTRETVIRGEDEAEFAEYRENLLSQQIPGTPLEEILADRFVDLSWRLKRAARDQEKAFVVLYEKQTAGVGEALEPAQRDACRAGCTNNANWPEPIVRQRLVARCRSGNKANSRLRRGGTGPRGRRTMGKSCETKPIARSGTPRRCPRRAGAMDLESAPDAQRRCGYRMPAAPG